MMKKPGIKPVVKKPGAVTPTSSRPTFKTLVKEPKAPVHIKSGIDFTERNDLSIMPKDKLAKVNDGFAGSQAMRGARTL